MAKQNSSIVENKANRPALSFTDAHGATVTIPAGEAHDYAGIKAEQLRMVTQLLTISAVGNIDLPKSLSEHFQVTANALAHELEELISLVATDAANDANRCAQ